MEHKLVANLIELYKEKGIDLHVVIEDPLFERLHVEDQVQILKQFASHFSSNTAVGLSRNNVKAILIAAAIGGGITAIGSYAPLKLALSNFVNTPRLATVVTAAGLAGAGIGAAQSYISQRERVNQRNEMQSRFKELSETGSDNSALKILGSRHVNRLVNSSPNPLVDGANVILQTIGSHVIPNIASYNLSEHYNSKAMRNAEYGTSGVNYSDKVNTYFNTDPNLSNNINPLKNVRDRLSASAYSTAPYVDALKNLTEKQSR